MPIITEIDLDGLNTELAAAFNDRENHSSVFPTQEWTRHYRQRQKAEALGAVGCFEYVHHMKNGMPPKVREVLAKHGLRAVPVSSEDHVLSRRPGLDACGNVRKAEWFVTFALVPCQPNRYVKVG